MFNKANLTTVLASAIGATLAIVLIAPVVMKWTSPKIKA